MYVTADGFYLVPTAEVPLTNMHRDEILPASVLPFILRGVSLLGVDSVMAPIELRRSAWARLASDLDPEKLARITAGTIGLDAVQGAARDILAGIVRGRLVVDPNA